MSIGSYPTLKILDENNNEIPLKFGKPKKELQMGVMQPHAPMSVEAVKSEIDKIEDNSQCHVAPVNKQSIMQDTKNSGSLGHAEFKVPGAHHGPKQ